MKQQRYAFPAVCLVPKQVPLCLCVRLFALLCFVFVFFFLFVCLYSCGRKYKKNEERWFALLLVFSFSLLSTIASNLFRVATGSLYFHPLPSTTIFVCLFLCVFVALFFLRDHFFFSPHWKDLFSCFCFFSNRFFLFNPLFIFSDKWKCTLPPSKRCSLHLQASVRTHNLKKKKRQNWRLLRAKIEQVE